MDLVSNNFQTVLLTESGSVYQLAHKNSATDKVVKIQGLKNIVKLAAGFNHMLALKKVYRPAFIDWTTEMVTEFFSKQGFEECNSAIINTKIKARDLLEGDYQWFMDTFGLFGEIEWKRLKREMEQMRKPCLLETVLYGWGSNTFG